MILLAAINYLFMFILPAINYFGNFLADNDTISAHKYKVRVSFQQQFVKKLPKWTVSCINSTFIEILTQFKYLNPRLSGNLLHTN